MLGANVLCMKKRKKRSYCISNTSDHVPPPAKDKRPSGGVVAMMHITEDTPPDMLAGAMDLTIHLPSGRTVKMSVERSTPMMDLLVQITTSQHLQLSGYIIQALGMAPSAEYSDKILPYKPNTPIGALDTQHIRVIPKSRTIPVPKNVPPGHQPFESTFRLKVHLPRNQLYVCRVSRNVRLEEIMKKVCEEKNLDAVKYEFRHPGNLDEVLDPKLTLSDYQITEIYVTTRGTILTQAISTSDIMALRREEERRQMAAKTGGGVFNLIFKRGKTGMGSGSVSSENRSISPTQSDDSRSVSPPTVQKPIVQDPPAKPKPPQRKRRPAPKPPQQPVEKPSSQISNSASESSTVESQSKRAENTLTICHSRNSSDSSGYHEASILSDNCTLPRKFKHAVDDEGKLSGQHSQSTTNLSKMSTHSKSTSSLVHAGRKKKPAPPPPPVLKSASSVQEIEKPSPVVASLPSEPQVVEVHRVESRSIVEKQVSEVVEREPESAKQQPDEIQESLSTAPNVQSPRESVASPQPPSHTPSPSPPEILPAPTETENKDQNHAVQTNNEINLMLQKIEGKTEDIYNQEDDGFHDAHKELKADDDECDWQYQLPSPPTAFRDASPANFKEEDSASNCEPSSLTNILSTDSVVTSPELFEKLHQVKSSQAENDTSTVSDTNSTVSDEDNKNICNKLSLEHLEKRKSLVYNRELSTSLKSSELESKDTLTSKHSDVVNELEGVIQNNPTAKPSELSRQNSQAKDVKKPQESALPNFVITTYDNPKKKIKVFEDDSIRSNEQNKRAESLPKDPAPNNTPASNVTYRKHSLGNNPDDAIFKKPFDLAKRNSASYFPKAQNDNFVVTRSGSFSTDYSKWKPVTPVKRSKSQLTVAKNNVERTTDEGMERSNSLFDVSGLHSLEVMRMIQTKLSTPTNSTDNLNRVERSEQTEIPQEQRATVAEEKPAIKINQYRPPSINLSTWSERPKTQISVKEDTDYKMKNGSSRVVLNASPEIAQTKQTIEVVNNKNNVSIKINASEPIVSQGSKGNVIIKIGGSSPEPAKYATQPKVRPHSVAIDSGTDVSRVPIVRSVELKKPFKDSQMNRSVTQIYPDEPNFYKSNFSVGPDLSYATKNSFRNSGESKRVSDTFNGLKQSGSDSNFYVGAEPRPVLRNSGGYSIINAQPVVRGFRSNDSNVSTFRKSWNVNGNSAFPPKNEQKEILNANRNPTPFAQVTLRKTETNRASENNGSVKNNSPFGNVVLRNSHNTVINSNNYRNSIGAFPENGSAPPPPQMPKISTKKPRQIERSADPRDELLSAIRNFGGKKGLKAVKA